MELVVRTVTRPELDKAVEVEEKAMKGSGYLRDVSELFLSDEVGPLLGAYKDGEELVGIAKYTVLAVPHCLAGNPACRAGVSASGRRPPPL